MLRFKSQESPMFMRVVTETTKNSAGPKGGTRPEIHLGAQGGGKAVGKAGKGWERLKYFPAASPGEMEASRTRTVGYGRIFATVGRSGERGEGGHSNRPQRPVFPCPD